MDKRIEKALGRGFDFGYGGKSPPTRKPINKNLRDNVWLKYMGKKAEGKCYCCRIRPIHITHFDVGHNKAVSKGGYNNIENLRPICGPCNKGMRTKSIEWYRAKYYAKPRTPKPKKPKSKRRKRTTQNPYDPLGLTNRKQSWGNL